MWGECRIDTGRRSPDAVGLIQLFRGQGRLTIAIPFQVARNARLTVRAAGGSVILTNTAAWRP